MLAVLLLGTPSFFLQTPIIIIESRPFHFGVSRAHPFLIQGLQSFDSGFYIFDLMLPPFLF